MVLTPLEVEKLKFRVGFRGYLREDVEQFRDSVVTTLEQAIAQAQQLQARVSELEVQLKRYHEHEELLKNSVVLAQRTSDELIAAAHKQADAIKLTARGEGDEIRRELAELRSQREQFEYAFHGLLSGFLHRLEQGNPALTGGEPTPELAAPGRGQPVAPPPNPPSTEETAAPFEPTIQARLEAAPQPAPPPRPAPRIPDVPVPSIPSVKPFAPPTVPVARPGGTEQVDRDADIADFTAVLDEAKAPPQDWPRPVEPEPAAAEPDEAAPPEESAPAAPERGLPLDREWGAAPDADNAPDRTL
ncbi:DivIVA domain-containing protein [bacterium]|nr:DivIVA domain-containing protein [bacterium]